MVLIQGITKVFKLKLCKPNQSLTVVTLELLSKEDRKNTAASTTIHLANKRSLSR
jgi:hypothetical protein